MRYLLIHHPRLVYAVLFLVVMTLIGRFIAPYIVHHFGFVGAGIALAAMFGAAWLIDR